VNRWWQDDEEVLRRMMAWKGKGPPPNHLQWAWHSASPSLRKVTEKLSEKRADDLVHQAFVTASQRLLMRIDWFLEKHGDVKPSTVPEEPWTESRSRQLEIDLAKRRKQKWRCTKCGRVTAEKDLDGEMDWLDGYCPKPCLTHRTRLQKLVEPTRLQKLMGQKETVCPEWEKDRQKYIGQGLDP
jgi:hypothetical protein